MAMSPDDPAPRPAPATLAAQAAGQHDAATGGVVGGIHPATTFERTPDYARGPGHPVYGRDDDPTVREAERVIAALEEAADARLFASGMAAIAALLRQAPPGGAVAVQSGIYFGTGVLARRLESRGGIAVMPFDGTDPDSLASALAAAADRPGPRIVLAETPSNPWLAVADIAALAAVAHAAGATLAVDSTAATPILTRPLALGADVVVHSATKGLNGHSDVLAGALATNAPDDPLWEGVLAERHDAGAVLGAFPAWLLTRGMRTLALRVKAQSEAAYAIATFLAAHPAVETVRYPGLPAHPGHAVARRQMSGGFGPLLSFDVADGETARAVAARVRLAKRATSLGGVESLIEHRHSVEDAASGMSEKLLRLSVGIEDVDDLLADLERALADAARAPRR